MPIIQRILLTTCLLAVALTANAQSSAPGDYLTGTRPNAGGDPDEIRVRLGLIDLTEINDREQLFVADIFVQIEWHDPRLAVDDGVGDELRTVALDDIWHPSLTVVNDRGLDILLRQVATVDQQGHVSARQRLAGSLAVDLDLRKFPFDTQRLPIEIVSYQYSPSEISFSEDSELVGRMDELSDDSWTYEVLESESSVYRISDDARGTAGLTFSVKAIREPAYYIYTLALPMTLILFLAWMAHWLPVDLVPARMGTASATVFSLIAFGVSFRLTLPKIAYLTAADRFVLYSTLLVLVSLAIIVVTIRWVNADQKDVAERVARQVRLAFPLLFGLIVLLTFTA